MVRFEARKPYALLFAPLLAEGESVIDETSCPTNVQEVICPVTNETNRASQHRKTWPLKTSLAAAPNQSGTTSVRVPAAGRPCMSTGSAAAVVVFGLMISAAALLLGKSMSIPVPGTMFRMPRLPVSVWSVASSVSVRVEALAVERRMGG